MAQEPVERNVSVPSLMQSNGQQLGPVRSDGFPRGTYEILEDLIQPRGPSLKDFLTLLRKRRRIVASTAIGIFLFGFVYAFSMDDQYTAITTLEIRGYAPVLGEAPIEAMFETDTRKLTYQKTTTSKLTHLTLADAVLNRDGLGDEVREYIKKNRGFLSKASRFISRYVFRRGGQDAHLDETDPRFIHRQTFLNTYLKLLQINPIHETSLVQVRATTSDPKLSQRIANAHSEGLIRLLDTERRDELSSHLATLKAHADDLQQKLSQAEATVAEYAQKHELLGVADGAQGNLMLSQLTELTKLLSAAKAQRIESESKVTELSEKSKGSSSLLDDETVKDLRTKLKEAESEYAALSQLVTGEYPKLVELQGRIDSLRSTIREERAGSLSALKTQYESDVAAERLLINQFESQLRRAHEMSGQLVEYNLLQREAGSLRDLVQSVLKALNETQIGFSSAKSNVFVTDYAPLPRTPSAPRRNIIIVFSCVLGIIAGVALAVLRELLDSTIKVSDDAQAALGLPTLGIIPSFKALGGANLIEHDPLASLKERIFALLPFFNKDGASGPTASAPGIEHVESDEDGEPELATESGEEMSSEPTAAEVEEAPSATLTTGPGALALPEAGILDALRTLRANIMFSTAAGESRVILVASGREREGKTSVIGNLAVTFARASQRTLLIDGDLRRPRIARRFGVSKERFGLVDYLAGQCTVEEILAESSVPNLTIIPAGSATPDPTELLGSRRMADLVDLLRQHYDVVLMDGTPVLPVADSLMLAQLADTVIFVVRSRKTEKAVAQEAVSRLRRVGARVRGIVLNDFDPGHGNYSSDRYSISRYYEVLPPSAAEGETGGFEAKRAAG